MILKEGKKSKCSAMEEADFISNLPDSLLADIISLLPGTEGVATSVLAKRWKTMWKQSSHLTFDQRKMSKSLIENYLRETDPNMRLTKSLFRKYKVRKEEVVDAIAETAKSINLVLDSHFGGLKSCRIRHLPESCVSGEVMGWMRKLLEKGVKTISLEREPECVKCQEQLSRFQGYLWRTIELPFDIFSGFEVLELKNYNLTTSPSINPPQFLKTLTLNDVSVSSDVFQNILSDCSSLENLTLEKCYIKEVVIQTPSIKNFKICNMFVSKIVVSAVNIEVIKIDTVFSNAKNLDFKTPKLKVLHSHYDMKKEGLYIPAITDELLTTKEILQVFSDNLVSQGSTIGCIFENLVTLSINLDLKNLKNGIALSLALKSCHHLENLQINSKVDDDCSEVHNQNLDDCLPSEKNLFWQKNFFQGICHRLKTLNIKGFTGKDFEVEFVKYIIRNVETMERITLWFVDGSTWAEATTTFHLLFFPRASAKLSITLKPGMEYMTKVGGSFQKWISTLRG